MLWKPADGKEINIGKYMDSSGQTETGLRLDPEIIEGFLSGYFAEYQPISYGEVKVIKDTQQAFSVFGHAAPQRTDNAANKTSYTTCVPYKNLDNIRSFCDSYDRPLAAVYFNSQAGAVRSLLAALNLNTAVDQWLRLDDTAIVWCDIANTDGGKAALGGEWQTWVADLAAHPERQSDMHAFRFYSKFHGVDASYSFQQVYDRVYSSDKNTASSNFITFLQEVFKPYYDYQRYVKEGKVFTVEFMDYDGKYIIPYQEVLQGDNAVPPDQNPSRPGYTFTGYIPSYLNVQQNLTCVAQYVANEQPGGRGEYFAEHTYAAGASYQMRVSNNLCAIQVVGDMSVNGMKSQLTSVTFMGNLFQIMPSCFMNCAQL